MVACLHSKHHSHADFAIQCSQRRRPVILVDAVKAFAWFIQRISHRVGEAACLVHGFHGRAVNPVQAKRRGCARMDWIGGG